VPAGLPERGRVRVHAGGAGALSGALPPLDRIDLHVDGAGMADLSGAEPESAAVQQRVARARERQLARLGRGPVRVNARLTPRQLLRHCPLPPAGRELLARAAARLGFSARAHDRVLKVARTIADLAGADAIAVEHLAEALAYRTLDRGPFGPPGALAARQPDSVVAGPANRGSMTVTSGAAVPSSGRRPRIGHHGARRTRRYLAAPGGGGSTLSP
jgi:Mg-chelatase subunit ChlI